MENILTFIESNFVIVSILFSAVSFVLGIVCKEFIVDKCFKKLNKNRRKVIVEDSMKPQIFTQQIKDMSDYEELSKRIENCNCMLRGKILIKGDEAAKTTEFKTSMFNKTEILPLACNWRFIQIENPSAYTCYVNTINQSKKQTIKITSSELACIKANEYIGIIIDEYNKPDNIILSFNGYSIKYIISENRNNIKGEVI